jgi:hypothetical protein
MGEIGLNTTTTAVAEFLQEHLSDRVRKRKESIALGLKAVEEREKISAIMKLNAEAAGGSSSPSTGPGSDAALTEMGEKSAPGTLGLATITMNLPVSTRPVRFAILGVAAGLGLGIAGMLMMRGGDTPATSASASSVITSAPIPTTALPPSVPPPPSAEPDEPAATSTATATPTPPPSSSPRTLPRVRSIPPPVAHPKTRTSDGF